MPDIKSDESVGLKKLTAQGEHLVKNLRESLWDPLINEEWPDVFALTSEGQVARIKGTEAQAGLLFQAMVGGPGKTTFEVWALHEAALSDPKARRNPSGSTREATAAELARKPSVLHGLQRKVGLQLITAPGEIVPVFETKRVIIDPEFQQKAREIGRTLEIAQKKLDSNGPAIDLATGRLVDTDTGRIFAIERPVTSEPAGREAWRRG